MVNRSERRQLETLYESPEGAYAVLARSAAGLLLVLGVAIAGVTSPEGESLVATVSAPPAATDR